uniref:TPM domain-containing protein n=1 Tax=Panagrolaimus sp. PS1159 TaxID=55785 RepID=A0AC35G1T1_9BILA
MQPPDSYVYIFLLFFTLQLVIGQAQEWDSGNFPNPTASGFRECNMKTTSSICDPDGVLTEAERYRLNHELNQLEARTRQDHGGTFCEKKGVTGALAVAKHFRGGSEAAVKAVANEILKKWDLDRQCQKAVVIVMSTEDRKFWVARDDKVPIYAGEFTDLFNAQKQLFRAGNYQQGLHNILQGTWEKALSKQTGGVPSGGGGDGRKPMPPPKDDDYRPKPKPEGGSGFPKIPVTLIVTLVLIIIPLLCCCCCIYFCCCRNKGGQQPPAGHADIEGGGGYPPNAGGGMNRGGGGRPGLGGFLGGFGGSAAASSIMNMIRNKNRGGAAGSVPADAGYTPGVPIRHGENPEGKGLYPSVPVKDEGGGGSF